MNSPGAHVGTAVSGHAQNGLGMKSRYPIDHPLTLGGVPAWDGRFIGPNPKRNSLIIVSELPVIGSGSRVMLGQRRRRPRIARHGGAQAAKLLGFHCERRPAYGT